MKTGFALPNIGPVATAEAVVKVAQRAEALAYDSLWTIERLLWPVKPQTPYPVTPDGLLPEQYKYCLDPLDILLVAPAPDMKQRGAMADEFLPALKAIWTTNPVEFHGKFYQIPKSYLNRKPVQKPHPPIYLAAFAPAAMKRLATTADGWNPVAIPVDGMAQMFSAVKQMAKEAGRAPSSLAMVVRANLEITDKPLGKERVIFSGTMEQIKEDIAGCKRIGAHELFFDPTFQAHSLQEWLALMEQFRKLV